MAKKDNPANDKVLVLLTGAHRLLAEAKSLPELKLGRDQIEAAIRLAKSRRDIGQDAVIEAQVLLRMFERRLGEWLARMEKAPAGRPKKIGNTVLPISTLEDLGIAKMQSSRWQQEAKVPKPVFEKWVKEVKEKGSDNLTQSALIKLGRAPKEYEPEKPKGIPPTVSNMSWEKWLPKQPDCDLLFTDPPYMTDVDDIDAFVEAWLPESLDKVKPTGRAYICVGAYPDELFAYLSIQPPVHLIFDQVLVWTYRNTLGQNPTHKYKLNWQAILYYRGVDAPPLNVAKTKDQFAVFDINAPDGRLGDRCHAWQKPDNLANIIIQQSTAEGQLVLDPFCCTGTFILAANRFGRVGKGCDIDKGNLEIAKKRGCIYE